MKTNCIILIISCVSLIISITTLMCIYSSNEIQIKKILDTNSFFSNSIAILSLLVTVLLGWNIVSALGLKDEWNDIKKEIVEIKDETDSLIRIKYESRANTSYASGLIFLYKSNYVSALGSGLQCLNNQMNIYLQSLEMGNFTQTKELLSISLNGIKQGIDACDADFLKQEKSYMLEIISSVKNNKYYSCLDKDIKELIEEISSLLKKY